VVETDDTRRGRSQDSGFPPWWIALVTACAISVLAFVVLFLSGLRENVSESERSHQNLGILLMVIAVLPAWLSYFFANHGPDLHRAVAYCLGVALCSAGLAITV
jgi:cytochrome b561